MSAPIKTNDAWRKSCLEDCEVDLFLFRRGLAFRQLLEFKGTATTGGLPSARHCRRERRINWTSFVIQIFFENKNFRPQPVCIFLQTSSRARILKTEFFSEAIFFSAAPPKLCGFACYFISVFVHLFTPVCTNTNDLDLISTWNHSPNIRDKAVSNRHQ